MGEHARIARYFAPLTASEAGSFFLTDDAAVLTPPAGARLVITTDSVIEKVHMLAGASPQQFAQKLVRRNLSDLAAMGAAPWRYTLNLHTPHGMDDDWFAAFAAQLAADQTRFGMVLVGGDSTSAESAAIHAAMTCFGLVTGAPLLRSSAQAGDDVYVSGTVGDAAFGLAMLQHTLPPVAALIARYHCPEPRLALGAALVGVASAALDISDGLLADIAQLCTASGVGARIEQAHIPIAAGVQQILQQNTAHWSRVLHGGDDYELCFTAPASLRHFIDALAQTLALPLTRIGVVVAGSGVTLLDASGQPVPHSGTGYSHA